MFGTFYTSYSGLLVNSQALNVAGNNLANVNTTGYKKGQIGFSQLMTDLTQHSGNGNPMQFGLGAKVESISPNFAQGSLQSTGINSHVALEGEGFFQINQNGKTLYTRAGNFGFQPTGESTATLVTPSGAIVQGYTDVDNNGNIVTTGGLNNIEIDFDTALPGRATSLVRFVSNLDANAEPGEVVNTEITIYDETGEEHQLKLTMVKGDNPSDWSYQFDLDKGAIPNVAAGTLTFDENGLLSQVDGAAAADVPFTISGLSNGAPDIALNWDLVSDDSTGLFTNYSARSTSSTAFQDGRGVGNLENINIGRDGVILGLFDNGETAELARIGIGFFQNNQGLKQVQSGYFQETGASGAVNIDPNRGTIMLSGSLETSNVDIAEELTSLIVHQRGYQGNSKAITTTDQIIQESINLKR